MRSRLLFLSPLLLAASGCNPNFAMGDAPETPRAWSGPEGSGGNNTHTSTLDELVDRLKEKIAADTANKDLESRRQLGLLYAEQGKWDEAAAILEQAEVIDPKAVDIRVVRTRVLIRRRDEGAARAELEKATALAPDDEGVLRQWASFYMMVGDGAASVKASRKLLAKHPDLDDAEAIERQIFYVENLSKMKDNGKGAEFGNRIAAGATAQKDGKYEEAIGHYQQALEILPNDPSLWLDIGVCRRALKKDDDAVTAFRKSLSLDKNSSRTRVELARALAATGKKKDAIATLKEWQSLDAARAKKSDAAGLIAKLEKGESIDTSSGTAVASGSPAKGSLGHPGEAGIIRGTISIAPELAAKIPAGAKFFVFAKKSPAGGPPLAVDMQPAVPAFPFSFELSSRNLMMQGTQFEGSVYLTARIDADGSAGAGPGDLEGATSGAVAVGTDGVEIVIDGVRGADNQLVRGGGGGPAMAPATATAVAVATSAPSAGGTSISGTIDVSSALKAKIPGSATLFVFAKQNAGGGPPLAVHREPIGSATKFPISFSLSQSDAMMGQPFQGNLFLTARIDVDGVAGAGPGDLEGVTHDPVAVGTQGVKLLIDTAR